MPQLHQALAARAQYMSLIPPQYYPRQLGPLIVTGQQDNQQTGQVNDPAMLQQFLQHPPPQMLFSQLPQMGQAPLYGHNLQSQLLNGVYLPQGNLQQHAYRPMSFQDLRDRAQIIQNTIKDMEVRLQNARAEPEVESAHEASQLNLRLVSRKELLNKLDTAIQLMKQQGLEGATVEWVVNIFYQTGP